MSVPPWKQALMERKKQKDTEEQQKQVKEDEQLANLPAWKRAIILKQREKEKKDGSVKPERQNATPLETRTTVVTSTKSDPTESSDHQTVHVLSEKPAIPKSESADKLAKVDSAPQRRVGSLPKSQSFDVLAKPGLSERRTGIKPEPTPEKQTADVAKPDSSSERQPGIGLPKSQSSDKLAKINSVEQQKTASVPRSELIGKQSAALLRRPEPPGKVTKTASIPREQTTPTPAPEVPKDTAKQPQPALPSNAGEAVSPSNAPPPVAENKVPQLSAQQPTEQLPVTEARLEQPQALPPLLQNATPAVQPLSNQDETDTSRVSSNRNSLEIPPSLAPAPSTAMQPPKAQSSEGRKISVEEMNTKTPVPIPAWKKALLERKKSTSTQPVVPHDQAAAREPQCPTVVLKPVHKQAGKSTVAPVSTGTTPIVSAPGDTPLAAPTMVPAGTPKSAPDLKLKATPKYVTPKVMSSVAPKAAPVVTPLAEENIEQKASFSTSTKPQPGVYQKTPVKPPTSPRTSISSPPPTPTPAPPPSQSAPPTATSPPPPSAPEVVSSETKETMKLVQREGVELHPPVFQEVKEWANVPENDPQFQGLPQWKKALILRRREDIAKRSGQSTGNVPRPTAEQHRKISAPLGQTVGSEKTKPVHPPGANDRAESGPNLSQSVETSSNKSIAASSNQPAEVTPSQTVRASSRQSYDVTSTQPSGVKTLLGRFGPKDQMKDAAPNTTSSQLTPSNGKSKSPTGSTVFFPTLQTKATTPESSKTVGLKPSLFSPPPNQLSPMHPSSNNTSEPSPPVGSSARPTSPDADADDQESDDDLEVTNIDDVLGEEVDDEVDGGGCSAPIVIQSIQSDAFLPHESASIPLASVKTSGLDKAIPLASVKTKDLDKAIASSSSTLPELLSVSKGNTIPSTFTPLSPPTSPLQKIPPTSPTSPISPTSGAVRSILIAGEAPLKKSKPMRRVSWSDSTLVVQHTYPKYTYEDYDDMQEVKEGDEGTSEADGSGGGQVLDLPVHPMLQTTKANRDMYSTQPKASSVSTPQSMHNYKPSIIASYGSSLEDNLNDRGYLPGAEDSKEAKPGVPSTAAKGSKEDDKSDQPASSAYSADIAALIW